MTYQSNNLTPDPQQHLPLGSPEEILGAMMLAQAKRDGQKGKAPKSIHHNSGNSKSQSERRARTAAKILAIVFEQGPMLCSEIVAQVDVAHRTVHDHILSMTKDGVIRRVESSGHFHRYEVVANNGSTGEGE